MALVRAERRLRRPPEEVTRRQLLALRQVLHHASSAVPFFQDQAAYRWRPESLAGLSELPITERADLAKLPLEARRGTPVSERTLVKHTSGSSGQYLTVEQGARGAWWQGLLALRRNRARGVQPWELTAAIRVGVDERPRLGLLGSLARRTAVLDSGAEPAALAAALAALQPVALSGFGHLLLDVGRHLGSTVHPRVLATGGQVLAQTDRQALEEVFGARPLDLYGAVEVGSIAWQCAAADLYHVDHDSVIVEVVDHRGAPVRPGEAGEVLVTTLWNPHMPFIRYRLGDQARMADRACRCGATGPAIEEIEGRKMDRFVDEDHRPVASSRLFLSSQLSEVLPWVSRYRAVQDEWGRVTVEVVPVKALPSEAVARIVEGYRSVLGPSVPVSVVIVDDLPIEPSGKLRQFVSRAGTRA